VLLPRLQNRERRELFPLLGGVLVCVLTLAFVYLAGRVTAGDTHAFDVEILERLRDAADPSRPVGPSWMEGVLLDVTALGSPTVLGLLSLTVSGFLLLQGRPRTAALVLFTLASGELLNELLKAFFDRPRPSIVPHLRAVTTASFPSGHAMQAAIIYLTLGALMMRVASGWLTKSYCMGMAILITTLVGASRVALGVHYPTDVLGGWLVGFIWAAVAWTFAWRFDRTVRDERSHAA